MILINLATKVPYLPLRSLYLSENVLFHGNCGGNRSAESIQNKREATGRHYAE